jgi:HlyD family secretion protein
MATRPPHRRAVRWVVALLALLIIGGVSAVLLRPHGVSVQVSVARRGDLLVSVQCDGVLESPRGGEVRTTEPGTVGEVLATDGSEVRAGQLLVRLHNPELEAQALEAREAALRLATEKASASAELAKAQLDVKHWDEVVSADHRLLEQMAITRSTLESDELAQNDARTRQRTAKAQLAGLSGERGRLELARLAATELERRVAALALHARRAGYVYGLFAKAGEAVQVGQLLAGVADRDHPVVRLRVDQPDLPRITAGQRLIVTFGGLPDERWEGKVVSAAQVLRDVGGREVGEVLGGLSDPQHALPLNASVDARIVVGEKTAALTVPRGALNRDGSRRFVYALRDGRAHRVDVSVGLIGLSEVEITAGLAEGDPVLLAGAVPLSEGLRVAPAP